MRQWAKAVLISDHGFVKIVEIKNNGWDNGLKPFLSYNYGSFEIKTIRLDIWPKLLFHCHGPVCITEH